MAEPATGVAVGALKRFDRLRERGGEVPRYYEVFARRNSDDALTHVGSVEAPNDDLAQVRAWYIYDQHEWREMCVVPTDAVIPVSGHPQDTKIKMV